MAKLATRTVITPAHIEKKRQNLLELNQAPKYLITAKDVVRELFPEITESLRLGYDWDDISSRLDDDEMRMPTSTLRKYYYDILREKQDPEKTGEVIDFVAPKTRKPRAKKTQATTESSINNDSAVETVAQVIEVPTEPAIAEAVVESQVAPESPIEAQAPVAEVSEADTEAVVAEPQAETAIAEVPTSESATEAPVTETQAETEESASELDVEVQSPEVESTTESSTASEPSGGTSEDDWNEEELDEEEQRRKLMAEACGLDYVPRHKRRPQVEIGNFRK